MQATIKEVQGMIVGANREVGKEVEGGGRVGNTDRERKKEREEREEWEVKEGSTGGCCYRRRRRDDTGTGEWRKEVNAKPAFTAIGAGSARLSWLLTFGIPPLVPSRLLKEKDNRISHEVRRARPLPCLRNDGAVAVPECRVTGLGRWDKSYSSSSKPHRDPDTEAGGRFLSVLRSVWMWIYDEWVDQDRVKDSQARKPYPAPQPSGVPQELPGSPPMEPGAAVLLILPPNQYPGPRRREKQPVREELLKAVTEVTPKPLESHQ
ncbi:hypothetical protein Q8A73_001988 [Channa argus]|nr:hypothetical protein Q8A73_001988 [Channa argus]